MLVKGGTTSWKAISRWRRSTCLYTRIDRYVRKDRNTELERLTGGGQVCDDHHHVAELIYPHKAPTHVPFSLLLHRFVYVHHAPAVGGAILGVPLPASSGSFSGTFTLGIVKELSQQPLTHADAQGDLSVVVDDRHLDYRVGAAELMSQKPLPRYCTT